MVIKWFKPKRHSGFDKDYSVDKNIRVMLRNAPKNYKKETKLRLVGRQALALANVTRDRETELKARKVAKRAFKLLRELRGE